MLRKLPVILALAVALPAGAAAQQKSAAMDAAAKIANAMSAAPASISANATIVDWPASPRAQPTVLRKGSNGWVCYPDMPETQGNDPMCLDATWQKWGEAYMNKKPPKITSFGLAYMLAPGGADGSGTDPFAQKGTPTNDWGHDGPHTMMLYANASAYKGLPTRRSSGAYVMWAGTPWQHVMAPMK